MVSELIVRVSLTINKVENCTYSYCMINRGGEFRKETRDNSCKSLSKPTESAARSVELSRTLSNGQGLPNPLASRFLLLVTRRHVQQARF